MSGERHQKALLGGLEIVLGSKHRELKDQTAPVLILCYQRGIIDDEDVLKEWGRKASKKYVELEDSKMVRKAAAPFIEWLNQAETEDESEEE